MKKSLKSINELFIRKIIDFKNSFFSNPFAEILMIHRVRSQSSDNLPFFEDMSICPEFLESYILNKIKLGYEFISIDNLIFLLKNKTKIKHNKYLVLTVDDGYNDTYLNLYPILLKHEIPFIFYLSSSFPNKKIALWWNYLNEIIISSDKLILKDKRVFDISNLILKQKIYLKLSKEILKMGTDISSEFGNVFYDDYDFISKKYSNELISWDDIITMNKSTLCTIGAHTNMHFGLRFSSTELINKDIKENINDINNILDIVPKHFAYPYGTYFSVGHREFNIAKKFEFISAVNTYSSKIYNSDKNHIFSLPRTVLKNE